MNAKYKQLEEAILKEADLLIEKAKSQGEKALYNLFKSAVLKKYKDQYDVNIQQGEVEKDTVDKSIDFLFENACVSFRTLPNIKDSDKENVIRQAQAALPSWKVMVIQNLTNKGGLTYASPTSNILRHRYLPCDASWHQQTRYL